MHKILIKCCIDKIQSWIPEENPVMFVVGKNLIVLFPKRNSFVNILPSKICWHETKKLITSEINRPEKDILSDKTMFESTCIILRIHAYIPDEEIIFNVNYNGDFRIILPNRKAIIHFDVGEYWCVIKHMLKNSTKKIK